MRLIGIDMKLAFFVLTPITLALASTYRSPQKCGRLYIACLEDGKFNKMRCATDRITCLVEYCTIEVTRNNRIRGKGSSDNKKEVRTCILKHPVKLAVTMPFWIRSTD
ncbi:hypothetical protein ScPMuIL_010368 [Solemya velum]